MADLDSFGDGEIDFAALVNPEGKITENEDLKGIFGRFVGVPISTQPTKRTVFPGYVYDYNQPTDEGRAVLNEIYAAAVAGGIDLQNLNIWDPLSGRTMDNVISRLNLHIHEDESGNWILQDKYDYG